MSKEQKEKKTVSINDDAMPFKKTKSFSMAFGLMRGVTITSIVVMGFVIVAGFYFVNVANNEANQRAFFVSDVGAMVGEKTDKNDRRVEIRSHIKVFMEHMFDLDAGSYQSNIEKALHMIGRDGRIIYERYQANNFHQELVKNSASLVVTIDSLKINPELKEPFQAVVYARQSYITGAGSREQFLWATMELQSTTRTDKNPHGLRIEEFNTINTDIVVR